MKYLLSVVLSASTLLVCGQRTFEFREYLDAEVTLNGTALEHALAGGLNNPQFSSVDLDLDGTEDLLVFERDGNVLLPFVTEGSGSNTHYRYAPEYKSAFPPGLTTIVKMIDYNCDGKADLFCKVQNGLGVYENVSTDSLKFSWALGTNKYLPTTFANGQNSNVYVLGIDMPVIDDVDGDGDVDILAFEVNGVQVYFYENIASDHCGLDYTLSQECWGGFRENPNNNGVELDACITGAAPPDPENTVHAGSTILSLDMDGDGLEELVLGDVSFGEATLVENSGTPDSAYMTNQVNNWAPDGDHMIDLYVFPAFFYLDVTHDGVPDLVAAPNIMPSKNLNQVWIYENQGTASSPSFDFSDSAFLQNSMIDMGEGAFPTFADINSDGGADIIIGNRGVWTSGGNYSPQLWYLKNTSDGSDFSFEIASKQLVSFNGINDPTSPIPTFADMDNDGDLDLVIGFEDGTLAYYENVGTPTAPSFTLQTANYGGIDVGQGAAPELYDLNDDGLFDLVIGEKEGTLNYYENNGNGFTLISEKFGGVNVDKYGTRTGYSVPRFYNYKGRDQLMVGSEELGIFQYDSATAIVSQPSTIVAKAGTGSVSTSDFNETPFGAIKRTGRNQFLYTAAELEALGFGYGQIEQIAFNITSSTTSNSLTNGATIRMKNTTVSALNAFETNLDKVYDYSMPLTPGWNEINLQTPFVWDGKSNLVVEICFSRNLPFQDNPVEATDVGFPANAYGDITGYNSNTANGCEMPYGSTSTVRPNMRLTIRPITSPAGNIINDVMRRMNADFADLDFDDYPEAVVGNFAGGITILKGKALDISVWEPSNPVQASIYPNPTTGLIRIDLEGPGNTEYQILDLNGRVHARGVLNETGQVDLSGWANGIYIIHLINENGVPGYAKIIKQ